MVDGDMAEVEMDEVVVEDIIIIMVLGVEASLLWH